MSCEKIAALRLMRRLPLLCGLLLLILSGVANAYDKMPTGLQDSTEKSDAGLVWPNKESSANSDDWIRLHHREIRQMRPRVLVLNFVNGLSTEQATKKANDLIAALRESSRWHGYKDSKATPFLDYQIFQVVNLTDADALPEDQRLDGNSSLYPRVPDWKEGQINFQYDALFGREFAQNLNIKDPTNTTHLMTLSELVERGMVNEVWFFALQGKFGAPFECTEVKQAYNANLRKISGKSVQAGNGGTDAQPFIGRSLRILFINSEQGIGRAMEHLGSALEHTATSGAIPYLSRYFTEYAGFDLKKRYRMPFDSFYERNGVELDFPGEHAIAFKWKGEILTFPNYVPIGGSVHFMPTARRDYDLTNTNIILSTIEHYRMFDGIEGKDKAEPWNNAAFAKYRPLAPDGQGPWMVYWRQNMPGLDNKAKDDTGKPMLNWWPFLFY